MIRWEKIFYAVCGIAVFAVIAYRAATLSIVHDEATTIEMTGDTYRNLFCSLNNFRSANNHILNSLLTKWCRTHISTAEWATRLPNVLSFVLYYISLVSLAYKISYHAWSRILLVLLCTLDIYMLDFFSLCRGYGMANAFQMCALYFLVRDIKKGNIIVLPFFLGAIAVFANFTWIVILAAIGCTAGILTYIQAQGNWSDRLLKVTQKCWPGLVILIALYFLVHNQIEHLVKMDEFKWGANLWWEAQYTYVKNFLYRYQLPDYQYYIVQVLLIILYLLAWWTYYLKRDRMLLIALLLISVVFFITIMQRNLLDIRYINERKATMYISLTALVITTLAQSWTDKKISKILSIALCAMMLIRPFVLLHPNIVAEWYYDAYTKSMMEIVAKKKPKAIALHCLFHPSARVYRTQLNLQDSLIIYETRDLYSPSEIDAYYLMPDDTIRPIGYDTVFKGISGQIFLMKRGL